MKNNKFDKRVVLIHTVGLATVVALVGVYHYCFSKPSHAQVAADQAQIARLRELVAQPGVWEADSRTLQTRYSGLAKAVASIRERSQGESRDDLFLQHAEELAESVGLKVVDWSLGADRQLDDFMESRIEGKFSGSYASICEFLASVDQIPSVAKILRFDLRKRQNSKAYPISISFALYYSSASHDTQLRGTNL